MSRDRYFHRLLDVDDDPFFPSFPFPTTSSCPYISASAPHHRFLLDDQPFYPTSCPLGFTSPTPSLIDTFDLDLLLPPHAAVATPRCPAFDFDPFLLDALGHRVSALERALALTPAPAPAPPRRKYTYAAEAHGRKVKWTAEDRPSGGRNLKWEAELRTPHHDGFDRKWKWESKASAAGAATKVKWEKEIKGKGFLEPWSNSYSVEETYGDDDHDDDKEKKPTDVNVKRKVKEDKQQHKKGNVEIVEIEDNTAGCVAIRKVRSFFLLCSLLLHTAW